MIRFKKIRNDSINWTAFLLKKRREGGYPQHPELEARRHCAREWINLHVRGTHMTEVRFCPWCCQDTEQRLHLGGFGVGSGWECTVCRRLWYMCPQHKQYTADLPPADGKSCTCFTHPGCGPKYWEGCQCPQCLEQDRSIREF